MSDNIKTIKDRVEEAAGNGNSGVEAKIYFDENCIVRAMNVKPMSGTKHSNQIDAAQAVLNAGWLMMKQAGVPAVELISILEKFDHFIEANGEITSSLDDTSMENVH